MGLIKAGLGLGAGALLLNQVSKNHERHEETRYQHEQAMFERQREQQGYSHPQRSGGANEGYYSHQTWCNGSCGGRCSGGASVGGPMGQAPHQTREVSEAGSEVPRAELKDAKVAPPSYGA